MALSLSRIIAHRGASGYCPENTLAAFKKAAKLGITWVEFDVMLSKDGIAVVIHDETVNRTTDHSGSVGDFSLEQLQKMDAGSWFDSSFKREFIPSFEQVLACLAEYGMGANIEIKPLPGQAIETTHVVMDTLEAHWPDQCPRPLISSFDYACLRQARARGAQWQLGLLCHEWPDDWEALADDIQSHTVHLHHSLVNKARVAAIQDTGRAVLVYTVNEPAKARKFFDMGVDAVFSDYPDLLLSV